MCCFSGVQILGTHHDMDKDTRGHAYLWATWIIQFAQVYVHHMFIYTINKAGFKEISFEFIILAAHLLLDILVVDGQVPLMLMTQK